MRPMIATIAATMLVTIQTMPRAERGIGALTIAVDGHWNSRIAGRVGSFGSARRRSTVKLFEALLLITWFITRPLHWRPAAARPPDGPLGPPDGGSAAPKAGDKSSSARRARCAATYPPRDPAQAPRS